MELIASAKISVGPGGDVAARRSDGGVYAFNRVRVGASHDDKRLIRAGVDGGLEAIAHF